MENRVGFPDADTLFSAENPIYTSRSSGQFHLFQATRMGKHS